MDFNHFIKNTEIIKNKVLGVDVLITVAELRSMRIFVAGDAYLYFVPRFVDLSEEEKLRGRC